MAKLIAAIAIEFEALTPYAAVFCIAVDDLDETLEAAEERHAFIMQTDQQIMVREFFATLIQYHGHLSGFAGIAATVRYKGSGRVMPKQFIQRISDRCVGYADDRAHTVLHGFVAQLAGSAQLV